MVAEPAEDDGGASGVVWYTQGDVEGALSSSSWPQIVYADVVEEGGSGLGRLRVVGLEKDGHGGAGGGGDDLGVHPDVLPRLLPGVPSYF